MPATVTPSLLVQMRQVSVEDMLLPLLIQMVLIIAVARLFMTTPLLLRLARGSELEELIRESGFLGRAPVEEKAGRESA
jgi:hypothetical protein